MRELDRQDLQWSMRRCPRPVLALLKELASTVYVGGGFIRACVANEAVSDVDVFASSMAMARECAVFVRSKVNGAKLHETDNAFTVHGGELKMPVQVIHRWVYEQPEQLISSFDFTIAMACFWWDAGQVGSPPLPSRPYVKYRNPGWRSVCDDRFYTDLAAKRLRYTSPVRMEDSGGSLLRVLKFYQKGYRIPLDSLGAVVARLAGDIKAEKLLSGREPDRETQLAKVFTGLLREVDPNIDPTHIAHLPSNAEGEDDAAIA